MIAPFDPESRLINNAPTQQRRDPCSCRVCQYGESSVHDRESGGSQMVSRDAGELFKYEASQLKAQQ